MYFPVKPGAVVTLFSNSCHRSVGGFAYRLDRERGCRRASSERETKRSDGGTSLCWLGLKRLSVDPHGQELAASAPRNNQDSLPERSKSVQPSRPWILVGERRDMVRSGWQLKGETRQRKGVHLYRRWWGK